MVPGIANSSFSVQGSLFRRIDALLGEFRVGGGVHDSYTFQCGLVGSFTSPGIYRHCQKRNDRRGERIENMEGILHGADE